MTDSHIRANPTEIPPEIDRWNWGAFLLNWVWGGGNNTFYQLGVFRLQANSAAVAALGAPIATGIPSGKIDLNGSSGTAALEFSATGTKATGHLVLEAVRKNGVWSLTTLRLKIDGRDDVVDLLGESRADMQVLPLIAPREPARTGRQIVSLFASSSTSLLL